MRRHNVEVGVEVFDVDADVRSRLSAVNEDGHAVSAGYFNHLFHRVDGAENIRHVAESDESSVFGKHIFVDVLAEFAFFVDRHDIDANALTLLQQLPWHDVGMVFHGGKNNFVAVAELFAVGRSHEVDCFCCAASEDDFFSRVGIEEASHLLAGVFHTVGGFLRQLVNATMNVGFLGVIHVANLVDNALRRLRSGGSVEVDKLAVENLPSKYGIFRAYFVDVEHLCGFSLCSIDFVGMKRMTTLDCSRIGFRRGVAGGL